MEAGKIIFGEPLNCRTIKCATALSLFHCHSFGACSKGNPASVKGPVERDHVYIRESVRIKMIFCEKMTCTVYFLPVFSSMYIQC